MAIIGKDIHPAKALLEMGKLVAIPTETVYGLAANALDAKAAATIFAVKDRPSFDPLIVHVDSVKAIERFAKDIPPQAEILISRFWPGPLTILLPKKYIIPDLVTSGLNRVGLRCPDHPLTLELLRNLSFPLAAPSANPFGYVSPTTAQHVNDQLGEKIEYILDGGPSTVGIESTIVGWENEKPMVYRLGGISFELIQDAIGKVSVQSHSTSHPQAPGQLTSHYSPGKKFVLGDIEFLHSKFSNLKAGTLYFKKPTSRLRENQLVLSDSGDLNEAARNLFSMLRKFDSMDIDIVIAEAVPETGLGRAINDRLRRAAAIA